MPYSESSRTTVRGREALAADRGQRERGLTPTPDSVRRISLALVRTLLAAAVAVLLALGAGACAEPLVVTVGDGPEWGWTRQPAPLTLGVTHTQYSLARSDPAEARARGTAVLRGAGV